MKKSWKTKEVAGELKVNQKTIQRWIKQYQLNCFISEAGHYVIDKESYKKLHEISKEMGNKRGEQEKAKHSGVSLESMVSSEQLDERFHKLLLQIDQLDRQIQSKADEIVEFQVLQHRKELDDLCSSLEKFNTRLDKIEKQINAGSDKVVHLHDKVTGKKINNKRSRLSGIFSF